MLREFLYSSKCSFDNFVQWVTLPRNRKRYYIIDCEKCPIAQWVKLAMHTRKHIQVGANANSVTLGKEDVIMPEWIRLFIIKFDDCIGSKKNGYNYMVKITVTVEDFKHLLHVGGE